MAVKIERLLFLFSGQRHVPLGSGRCNRIVARTLHQNKCTIWTELQTFWRQTSSDILDLEAVTAHMQRIGGAHAMHSLAAATFNKKSFFIIIAYIRLLILCSSVFCDNSVADAAEEALWLQKEIILYWPRERKAPSTWHKSIKYIYRETKHQKTR